MSSRERGVDDSIDDGGTIVWCGWVGSRTAVATSVFIFTCASAKQKYGIILVTCAHACDVQCTPVNTELDDAYFIICFCHACVIQQARRLLTRRRSQRRRRPSAARRSARKLRASSVSMRSFDLGVKIATKMFPKLLRCRLPCCHEMSTNNLSANRKAEWHCEEPRKSQRCPCTRSNLPSYHTRCE